MITPLMVALYDSLHKINPEMPAKFDNWLNRRYYAACDGPGWWWRFWFEATGQGRVARRYKRATSRNRRRPRRTERTK